MGTQRTSPVFRGAFANRGLVLQRHFGKVPGGRRGPHAEAIISESLSLLGHRQDPEEAPQGTLSLAPLPTAEKLPLSPAVATGTDGLPGPTRGTCSVLEATDLAGPIYGH